MKKLIAAIGVGLFVGILATFVYFIQYNKRTSSVSGMDHYRCVEDKVCAFSDDSVNYLLFYGDGGEYKVLQLYDKNSTFTKKGYSELKTYLRKKLNGKYEPVR